MADSTRVTRAVFPLAGLGTRFLPATKSVPKEMLPLVDRPCLDYVVAEAVEAGIGDLVFITAKGKGAIEEHFNPSPQLEAYLQEREKTALLAEVRRASQLARIVSIRQHQALGLGHAVLTARPAIGEEPFAVLLGDDVVDAEQPALGQLLQAWTAPDSCMVALLQVPWEHTERYGICAGAMTDRLMHVTGMVEKPKREDAPSNYSIVGRYILPAGIFDILASTQPGAGGEIQLTDALAVLAEQGRAWGYCFEGGRFDTGNVLGLIRATLHFALKREDLGADLRAIMRELLAE